jgi:Holliday junction resolvase RusA-like endonuclease
MTKFTYTILGIPRSGKNSQQLMKAGNRRFVRKSKAASGWLATAAIQLREQLGRRSPLPGAVRVDIIAYQPSDRCDLDNMVSLVYDALKGCVIHDDKYIVCGWSEKRVDKGNPRVEVTICPA